jgi:hypothetical protein
VRNRFSIGGTALLIAGLGTSIILAVTASTSDAPNASESALLVLIGAALNGGSAWLFSKGNSRLNLKAARIALRHLDQGAQLAAAARALAEDAFDESNAARSRQKLGRLSVQLSSVEQQLGSNLQDWSDAVEGLTELTEEE